ncbi:hypothetical protein [Pseudomonas laurentiana]
MLADVARRMGKWARSRFMRCVTGKPLSLEEQEISASLRGLQTLRCEGGRVSVDPVEVIDRPGYRSARAAAAALVSGVPEREQVISEVALDEFGDLVVRHLLRSLQRGNTFEQAQALLNEVLHEGIRQVRSAQDAER